MLSVIQNLFRPKPYAWIAFFAPLSGLLPFLVYALTVSTTASSGQSAYLTAVAAGIEQHSALTKPLFVQLTQAVAMLPLGPLPLRLNFMCCIFAALTAMLFYRFVARLIYLFARENPGGSAHVVWNDLSTIQHREDTDDEEDENTDDGQSPENSITFEDFAQQNQHAARSAAIGSFAATLFFCFSAPFWLASTRLFSEPFHYMLILVMANLALNLWHQKQNINLFTSALIAGLIWIETPITALCSVSIAIYLIVSIAKAPLTTTWEPISYVVAGLISGLGLACTTLWFSAAQIKTLSDQSPLSLLLTFVHDQFATLSTYIPSSSWIAVAAFIALPSLLALVLINEGFRHRSWLVLIADIAWGVLLIPTIINLPHGVWSLAQQQTIYPILIFFILAVQIGFFIAIGQQMSDGFSAQDNEEIDDYEYRDNAVVCKIGYFLSWSFFCITLTTACWYYADVLSKNNAFMNRIAHEIFHQLGKRDWIVDDTLTQYQLPILMQAEHRALYSISVEQPLSSNRKEAITHLLKTDPSLRTITHRLYNALDLSTEQFLTHWLRADPHACDRIAFIRNADLLRKNGYDVLATGFLLIGRKNASDAAIDENVKTFLAWTDTIQPLVQAKAPFPIEGQERERRAACEQIALVANELAYLLATHRQEDMARHLLQRAQAFDANNISAAVNYHYLISSTTNTVAITFAENQLKQIAYEALQRCPIAQQVQTVYGTLLNTNHYRRVRSTYWVHAEKNTDTSVSYKTLNIGNADDNRKQQDHLRSLIRESLSTYRMDQADQQLDMLLEIAPTDTFAWVTRMMIALNKRDFPAAQRWMQKAKTCGASPADLLCYEANLLVASNQLAEARAKLEKQVRETPDDIRLWEILSTILIEQKEFGHLDNRIYPAVRNATNMEEHYLQHLIRAHVLLFRSPEQYTAARILFHRAITLNPHLSEAWIDLFRLDESLENPVFCETDAKARLVQEPTHPFANYLLGRARLLHGELDLANDLFDQALCSDPTLPEAYAGLAEVKLAQKQSSDARKLILKAFALGRTNTRIHITLLTISLSTDQLDLADQLIQENVLNTKDPHIQILLARLQLKKGAPAAAKAQLAPLLKTQNNLPPNLVKLIQDLAEELAQQKENK